jgi:serine/threonine protein kinase
MSTYLRPADRFTNENLKNGWQIISKYQPKHTDGASYSFCYIVSNGEKEGFLKAFDYSDLRKAGGKALFKHLNHKFESELAMLKRCNDLNIDSVIKLLHSDSYFFEENVIDERVDYFILEYSKDDNLFSCLTDGNLKEFAAKFQALIHVFDGLENLHNNGIMHLDIKATNLVHFLKERVTKITDFGSARKFISDLDEDLHDELNSIITTRQYAPPEFFYKEEEYALEDWNKYRRKIDLYLVGNVIVKLFTNLSFTTLLKKALPDFYDWDMPHNEGKMKQFLPTLISAASEVYQIIENEIHNLNKECGNPLERQHVEDLVKIIAELCNPNPDERGHPKELVRITKSDGLYRHRDQFVTFKNLCTK